MTLEASYLRDHADGCSISIRVQPGARKTEISGIYGEREQAALKIAVQAPPIDGRANEALLAYLANALGVPRKAVVLLSGESSRSKVFLIKNAKVDEIRARLSELLA